MSAHMHVRVHVRVGFQQATDSSFFS